MPKKPAPKGTRSKGAKNLRRNRAHNDQSARIQDLSIESRNIDGTDAVVRGGSPKQGADTPKESISFTFTKPNTSY